MKAICYRLLGSLLTATIVYAFTDKIPLALGVGSLEFFLKIIFYYVHERIWFKINILKEQRTDVAEWSYLAGFLDGDGWITITKRKDVIVGFCQKEIKILKDISRFLKQNGIYSAFSKSSKGFKNITINVLRIERNSDALHTLRQIEPFLKIKKNKARQAIYVIRKFRNTKRKYFNYEDKQTVRKLLRKGSSIKNICKHYGCSRTPIDKIKKESFGLFDWRKTSYFNRKRKRTGRFK